MLIYLGVRADAFDKGAEAEGETEPQQPAKAQV